MHVHTLIGLGPRLRPQGMNPLGFRVCKTWDLIEWQRKWQRRQGDHMTQVTANEGLGVVVVASQRCSMATMWIKGGVEGERNIQHHRSENVTCSDVHRGGHQQCGCFFVYLVVLLWFSVSILVELWEMFLDSYEFFVVVMSVMQRYSNVTSN